MFSIETKGMIEYTIYVGRRKIIVQIKRYL